MAVDEDVVRRLEEAIGLLEADLVFCEHSRAEAIARDSEVRMGSGVGVPPKPWAGYYHDETGIVIPDCSEIQEELRRLREELERARRGEPVPDPEFLPDSSDFEQGAMDAAVARANAARERAIKFWRDYAFATRTMGLVLTTAGVGLVVAGLALSSTVAGAPPGSIMAVSGAGIAVLGLIGQWAGWQCERNARELEAQR